MASQVPVLLILSLVMFSTCVVSNHHKVPCPPNTPTPKPPTPSTPKPKKCPVDTLKLGVCADVLGGLVSLTLGAPPVTPCCSLLEGLVDAEVGLCLCTVIKANVLGIVKLDIPVALSLLVNACGKEVPSGFTC